MGATALSLPALEVAVGGGGAALALGEDVGIHPQTHRAARLAPLEAGIAEDGVQALGLGLTLHLDRSGHHHGMHGGRHPAAAGDLRGGAQVLDPAVGARADEDPVDGDLVEPGPRPQPHVLERALHRLPVAGVVPLLGIGDGAGDRRHLGRVGAPAHVGNDLATIDHNRPVVARAGIAPQRGPVRHRLLPRRSGRRRRAALDIGGGGVVGGDHARPGARLDRHVADRHPPLHREAADHLARVLDHVTDGAVDADASDDREDHILGTDAEPEPAVDAHLHGAGSSLHQGLGRQRVLDLAGADAEGESTEGAVGRGVGVAADDGHSRLGEPQLGTDDMDDALARVAEPVAGDAEVAAVGQQSVHLLPRDGIRHRE